MAAFRQDKQAFGAISTGRGLILGPFAVKKEAISEVEPNNYPWQAQNLLESTLISGTIDTKDPFDTFAFTGKQGDIVTVICDTQGLGSSLESLVSISDSSLLKFAFNDENGLYHQNDSFVQLALPADGTYYIVVSDYSSEGGSDYAYRLHVALPPTSTP